MQDHSWEELALQICWNHERLKIKSVLVFFITDFGHDFKCLKFKNDISKWQNIQ